MDRYHCMDCGRYFTGEEAKVEKFWHSELAGMGGECAETYLICPSCQSNNLEDAYECEMCGEPTITEVCDRCRAKFIADLDEFFQNESGKYNGCDPETLKTITYYHIA